MFHREEQKKKQLLELKKVEKFLGNYEANNSTKFITFSSAIKYKYKDYYNSLCFFYLASILYLGIEFLKVDSKESIATPRSRDSARFTSLSESARDYFPTSEKCRTFHGSIRDVPQQSRLDLHLEGER